MTPAHFEVLYRSALGPWDPWSGSMHADAYEARFVRNRNYRMHQRAAPLRACVTLEEWQQDLTLLRLPVSRLWPDSPIRPDTCHGTIQPLADVAEAPGTPPAASQSVMDEPPLG